MLLCGGAHINYIPLIHEKLAIIDEEVFWDGSMNILSHFNTSERMEREINRIKVLDAMRRHRWLLCTQCWGNVIAMSDSPPDRSMKMIGEITAQRRRQLGLTQRQLAMQAGVGQCVISQLESGKRDLRMSTVSKVCQILGLEFRAVPWFLVPSLDQSISKTVAQS